MTIEAINFLPPLQMPAMPGTEAPAGAPSGAFASWFSQQLTDVNSQLATAEHGVQALAAGDASNLHQVMIDLEQAKISMQLVMQVRNHLLDAYHELMQMQM
jgi:flagellar hook-basal body complex protein FliE